MQTITRNVCQSTFIPGHSWSTGRPTTRMGTCNPGTDVECAIVKAAITMISNCTLDLSSLITFWLESTSTDLLTSTIIRTVGSVVCRFCGCGGRMVTGTAPVIQYIRMYLSSIHHVRRGSILNIFTHTHTFHGSEKQNDCRK